MSGNQGSKMKKQNHNLTIKSVSIALCLTMACQLIAGSAVGAQTSLKGPIKSDRARISDTDLINNNDTLGSGASDAVDSVTVGKPALSALVSITRTTDPFGLDAQGSRQISLDETAHFAVDNNLDIGISGLSENSKRALYYASMGKFLPDINLSYNYNYLKGHANLPFVGFGVQGLHFNNPVIITGAGFTYHAFRGGRIFYGTLQSRNNYRAAQHARHASVNDTLLQATKYYYDLMLQEAVLQARISAVRTSESQLKLNRDLKEGGLATNLDVYQAETQLSKDRQNLIDQQIARRDAAIKLSQYLNIDSGEDLTPTNSQLIKIRLVSEQLKPLDLLSLAIDRRPELKQYQELRLAAKRQINLEISRLMPTFDFSGNVYGVGETLSPAHRIISSNVIAVSSTGTAVSTPITISENRRLGAVWQIGYNIKWNFEGMGTVAAAETYSARYLARQAQLEQQKILNQIIADVRQSYLKTLSSENKIIETGSQVKSAAEELRLAQMRFRYGLGKNIDVLRAQQDYTSALIDKAQALTDFNVAQAQLLRDIGVLSTSTLTAHTPFKG